MPLCRPTAEPSQIPPEIWLHVFLHLPKADIASVSLTCASFSSLAQPMLFRSLSVSPFTAAVFPTKRIRRTLPEYQRTLKRLQFYASNRIAPRVKKCSIVPIFADPRKEVILDGHVDHRLFINAVFEVLPRFVNLENAKFAFVDISSGMNEQIRRLSLNSLELTFCSAERSVLPLHVRALTIDVLDLLTAAFKHDYPNPLLGNNFVPAVDANHLERLHIGGHWHKGSERLLSGICAVDIFPNLHALHVDFSVASSYSFLEALSRFPNLEELHITAYPSIGIFRPLRPPLLPLKVYEGPESAVLSFTNGYLLREVTLWGLDSRGIQRVNILGQNDCDESTLPHTLSELCRRSPHLETLEIHLHSLTSEILAHLCSFRILKRLRILISCAGTFPDLITLLRTMNVPPGLESLRVVTDLPRLKTKELGKIIAPLTHHITKLSPRFSTLMIKYGALTLRQVSWEPDWKTGGGRIIVGSKKDRKTMEVIDRLATECDERGTWSI